MHGKSARVLCGSQVTFRTECRTLRHQRAPHHARSTGLFAACDETDMRQPPVGVPALPWELAGGKGCVFWRLCQELCFRLRFDINEGCVRNQLAGTVAVHGTGTHYC